MTIKEIEAKSILRKHKKIDSWFVSLYGLNLYRGCTHNCVYCDGRSERYYVDGEFGEDVSVKVSAIEVLRRELDLEGKTSPYGYAAYSISQSKEPFSTLRRDLRRLKGVGKTTERIILEILETGTSSYYEKLMSN